MVEAFEVALPSFTGVLSKYEKMDGLFNAFLTLLPMLMLIFGSDFRLTGTPIEAVNGEMKVIV